MGKSALRNDQSATNAAMITEWEIEAVQHRSERRVSVKYAAKKKWATMLQNRSISGPILKMRWRWREWERAPEKKQDWTSKAKKRFSVEQAAERSETSMETDGEEKLEEILRRIYD